MRISLIVAAGGRGLRFRKKILRERVAAKGRPPVVSKLFLEFEGRPLLARAVSCFQKIHQICETILAVPRESQNAVRRLIRGSEWKNVRLVIGGRTRAESVRNAIRKMDPGNPWVMVHDGARPFVSAESVRKLIAARNPAGGVILARKVVPTIKQVRDAGLEIEKTVDRSRLYEAETPQLAPARLLKKAYRKNPAALEATDEASLLEFIHAPVRVLAHETWNPKITTPEDLKLAEAFFGTERQDGARTGFGRDTHRLVEGRRFYLGGVRIRYSKGALGHSDADALLHAIADAILGATGQGDIGEMFPDSDLRFKDMRSEKIVRAAAAVARRKNWVPAQVDTVVTLERPKLLPYKKAIKKKIAAMLGLSQEEVCVKAKTMEGLGPEGEGLAVTCEALVTMRRAG